MVSDDPGSTPEDERKVLLNHWEEIPAVVLIEASEKVFKSHPVREAILTILREGIEEEQNEDPERSIQCHALSPKEIKKLLGERQGIDMSQTNLYFHLNTLEKTGAIKVVTKLTEGRHKVTYYGRVAHLILPRDPEESLVTYRKLFAELTNLIKAKRPDIDAAELKGLPEEYLRVKMKKDRLMANWLSKQDPLMNREGIDGTLIYKLLKDVYSLDPENIRLLHRIADLIEVDYPE